MVEKLITILIFISLLLSFGFVFEKNTEKNTDFDKLEYVNDIGRCEIACESNSRGRTAGFATYFDDTEFACPNWNK